MKHLPLSPARSRMRGTDSQDALRPLDDSGGQRKLSVMTLLQLKQEISRLSLRERRELNAYMIRLRHESPQWKRMLSKRMREMDAGKKVSLNELARKLAGRE